MHDFQYRAGLSADASVCGKLPGKHGRHSAAWLNTLANGADVDDAGPDWRFHW